MPWGEEQDELTQEARLFLASPEVVFQELKKLSATKSNLLGRAGGLETVLVKRNQPLINLGLASYGANKDVVAGLYKHALEHRKMRRMPNTKKVFALPAYRTPRSQKWASSFISHKRL